MMELRNLWNFRPLFAIAGPPSLVVQAVFHRAGIPRHNLKRYGQHIIASRRRLHHAPTCVDQCIFKFGRAQQWRVFKRSRSDDAR